MMSRHSAEEKQTNKRPGGGSMEKLKEVEKTVLQFTGQ
jgi:hypothetical protein